MQRDTQYRYNSIEGYKVQIVKYGWVHSTVPSAQYRGKHSTATAVQRDTQYRYSSTKGYIIQILQYRGIHSKKQNLLKRSTQDKFS